MQGAVALFRGQHQRKEMNDMTRTNLLLGLACGTLALAVTVQAAPIVPTYTTFGTLSGATFGGSGIPNNAVAIFTYGNVTLGLTAHQRYSENPPVINNGAGDFYAVKGGDTYSSFPNPAYARWNFGWYALNMGSSYYSVDLLYDFDPLPGTGQGYHGVVHLDILPPKVPLQDSWNLGMSFLASSGNFILGSLSGSVTAPSGSFDPNKPGEYTFALILRDYLSGQELGRTAIRVNVVPEAGATVGLLGLGLAGLTLLRRRF
jgi:hypothetical protein